MPRFWRTRTRPAVISDRPSRAFMGLVQVTMFRFCRSQRRNAFGCSRSARPTRQRGRHRSSPCREIRRNTIGATAKTGALMYPAFRAACRRWNCDMPNEQAATGTIAGPHVQGCRAGSVDPIRVNFRPVLDLREKSAEAARPCSAARRVGKDRPRARDWPRS
jgi:hypothetical protein